MASSSSFHILMVNSLESYLSPAPSGPAQPQGDQPERRSKTMLHKILSREMPCNNDNIKVCTASRSQAQKSALQHKVRKAQSIHHSTESPMVEAWPGGGVTGAWPGWRRGGWAWPGWRRGIHSSGTQLNTGQLKRAGRAQQSLESLLAEMFNLNYHEDMQLNVSVLKTEEAGRVEGTGTHTSLGRLNLHKSQRQFIISGCVLVWGDGSVGKVPTMQA